MAFHLEKVNLTQCNIFFLQSDQKDPIEGDPRYLAPELLQGVFTKAADIFRCVIIIF